MANTVTSFYQTLISAASQASAVPVGTLQIADSIYKDYDPAVTQDIGKTLNVPLPDSQTNDIYDAGAGDFTLYDISATTVPIVMDKHPVASFKIASFEQFGTPERLREVFLDGALKGIKEHINGVVAALLNTTKFNVNPLINGMTGSKLTISKFLAAKSVLGDQKVDVDNPAMMSLLLPSTVYNTMMDTSTTEGSQWTQAADRWRARGRYRAFHRSVSLNAGMHHQAGSAGPDDGRRGYADLYRRLPAQVFDRAGHAATSRAGRPGRAVLLHGFRGDSGSRAIRLEPVEGRLRCYG